MDAILNRYASVQTHDIHAGNETWLRIFWIMDVMHIVCPASLRYAIIID